MIRPVCSFWMLVSLIASPAHAHHLMGQEEPLTLLTAFLSGLAHPIIELDHFAFVLVVGVIAAQGRMIPLAFILGTALGTLLLDISWTLSERVIGLSVLLGGLIVFLRVQVSQTLWIVPMTLAGLCHGYAYGQAIIGAQTGPLLAYLSGFILIQAGIISATAWIVSGWNQRLITRLGGVIVGAGAIFLLQTF